MKWKAPEKNTEPFAQTVKRTVIATTVIAGILFLLRVFPSDGQNNAALIARIWAVVFCIVFGGHWLELLFINHLKFALPRNVVVLFFARIFYWYVCAALLFGIAHPVNKLLSHGPGRMGNWWAFGFSILVLNF